MAKMMTWGMLLTVLVAGVASLATAQEIPSLKGKWTGTFTGGVRQGGGQLAPADVSPRFVHPGDRTYTLTIEEQDGRGFKGNWASTLGSETMHGVVRLDNRTLLMVDVDSSLTATLLSPTEMEFCNHTVGPTDHFAFCFLLKKQ